MRTSRTQALKFAFALPATRRENTGVPVDPDEKDPGHLRGQILPRQQARPGIAFEVHGQSPCLPRLLNARSLDHGLMKAVAALWVPAPRRSLRLFRLCVL